VSHGQAALSFARHLQIKRRVNDVANLTDIGIYTTFYILKNNKLKNDLTPSPDGEGERRIKLTPYIPLIPTFSLKGEGGGYLYRYLCLTVQDMDNKCLECRFHASKLDGLFSLDNCWG
jgi:hypothetical protein